MAIFNRRDFIRFGGLALAGTAMAQPGTSGTQDKMAATLTPVPGDRVKDGGSRLIPVDGKYHVWTKRFLHGPIKMLTLHGGPGMTHEYLECFEDFLPQAGIEFYYYDQLGSTYSDQPDDASLWTVPRFREEVEQVRAGLGLNRFYLYGHSWGGMLAIEYALKYPRFIKGLIISDMTASIADYVTHINALRQQLPAATRAILDKYEAKGDYTAPEYQDVMFKDVYSRYLCRVEPWPEPVLRTLRHVNEQVYHTMQGPNEFVVNGTFAHWNRWADLPRITVPTLLIVGRHDTMKVDDIRRMGRAIPHSRVTVCPNGSHLCMYDDQQTYFDSLLSFVRDVESNRFTGGK